MSESELLRLEELNDKEEAEIKKELKEDDKRGGEMDVTKTMKRLSNFAARTLQKDLSTTHVPDIIDILPPAPSPSGRASPMSVPKLVSQFSSSSTSSSSTSTHSTSQPQSTLQSYKPNYSYHLQLQKTPKVPPMPLLRCYLSQARLALFFGDMPTYSSCVQKAVELSETNPGAGDWDTRNRLTIYSAILKINRREFRQASTGLVNVIKTFNASEVINEASFCAYAVLCAMLGMERGEIKKKVLEEPDIIKFKVNDGGSGGDVMDIEGAEGAGVTPDGLAKHVLQMLEHFIACDYVAFFLSISELPTFMSPDPLLAPHKSYVVRELTVLGYNQFLASYKSVTVDAMATSFGLGPTFLDKDLSKLIASGRVQAKIDKVAGVVVTERLNNVNKGYKGIVEKGDKLLNNIQRLGRVLDM